MIYLRVKPLHNWLEATQVLFVDTLGRTPCLCTWHPSDPFTFSCNKVSFHDPYSPLPSLAYIRLVPPLVYELSSLIATL